MASAAPKPPKPIKLFCGYAHEDAEYCLRFRQGIKFLEYDGHIQAWYDGKIIAGQEWDNKIKGQLERADIIVFLVSPYLLASEYAYNTELRRALGRVQDGKARLVPVIISDCPWELTAFHKIQALPSEDCRPVCQWSDPNAYWTNVVRGLWQAVEELRADGAQESAAAAEAELVPPAAKKKPAPAKFKPKTKAAPPPMLVDSKGSGSYLTINEALAAATPGATIKVRPGEYREGLVLDKEVVIIGDGPRDEIVVISRDSACVLMSTEEARLVNMTLRYRASESGKKLYCVDIPQGRLRLENCDVSSDSLACIAVRGPHADPVVSSCRMHDGRSSGIIVKNNGRGLFEDCDIFGNALAGVGVWGGGSPAFKRCKIHDGMRSGVYVFGKNQGLFENCEIADNAFAGVHVKEDGNPTVKQCRINRNGYQGVWVREGGTGIFLDNDLTDNALGPWKIEDGCQVTRKGNRPNE